jgi:hypothetical protein
VSLISFYVALYLLLISKWLSYKGAAGPNIEELIEHMQLNLLFD